MDGCHYSCTHTLNWVDTYLFTCIRILEENFFKNFLQTGGWYQVSIEVDEIVIFMKRKYYNFSLMKYLVQNDKDDTVNLDKH